MLKQELNWQKVEAPKKNRTASNSISVTYRQKDVQRQRNQQKSSLETKQTSKKTEKSPQATMLTDFVQRKQPQMGQNQRLRSSIGSQMQLTTRTQQSTGEIVEKIDDCHVKMQQLLQELTDSVGQEHKSEVDPLQPQIIETTDAGTTLQKQLKVQKFQPVLLSQSRHTSPLITKAGSKTNKTSMTEVKPLNYKKREPKPQMHFANLQTTHAQQSASFEKFKSISDINEVAVEGPIINGVSFQTQQRPAAQHSPLARAKQFKTPLPTTYSITQTTKSPNPKSTGVIAKERQRQAVSQQKDKYKKNQKAQLESQRQSYVKIDILSAQVGSKDQLTETPAAAEQILATVSGTKNDNSIVLQEIVKESPTKDEQQESPFQNPPTFESIQKVTIEANTEVMKLNDLQETDKDDSQSTNAQPQQTQAASNIKNFCPLVSLAELNSSDLQAQQTVIQNSPTAHLRYLQPTISSQIKRVTSVANLPERQEPGNQETIDLQLSRNIGVASSRRNQTPQGIRPKHYSMATYSSTTKQNTINKLQRSQESSLGRDQENPASLYKNSPESPISQERTSTMRQKQHASNHQRAMLHNIIISNASNSGQNTSTIQKAAMLYTRPDEVQLEGLVKSGKYPPGVLPQRALPANGNYYHQVLRGGTSTKIANKINMIKPQAMQVRGSHPPFANTVSTKLMAGKHKKASSLDRSKEPDQELEDIMLGRIQLQEILDEVASIEQRYSKNVEEGQNDQRNTLTAVLHNYESCETGNLPPNTKTSKISQIDADYKHSQNVNTSSSKPFQPHLAGVAERILEDSQLDKKCTTQPSWHRHQASVKMQIQTAVTSPQKQSQSKNRNNQLKQKSLNPQFDQSNYTNNNLHRKSHNVQSRSSERKTALISSAEQLVQQYSINPIATHLKQSSQQPKPSQQVTKLVDAGHDLFPNSIFCETDKHRSPLTDANSGDNSYGATYRVALLSSEANKRIKTDQEHFGSFKITTVQSSKVEDAKTDSRAQFSNTTKADALKSSNNSLEHRLSQMGMQGPSSAQTSKDQQWQKNPMLVEKDISTTEGIQVYSAKISSGNNCLEGEQIPKDQTSRRSPQNKANDQDQIPHPERCVSHDIVTKAVTLAGTNVNQAVPMFQDIQLSSNKLGRTLQRRSVLGVSSYVRNSSKEDFVTQVDHSQPMPNSKKRHPMSNIFNSREYMPLDKRVSMTKTEGMTRPSKSPLPPKKLNAQKQSLKQLGLSYGILAKQDTSNKLIGSKKRGNQSKDMSPKKTPSKLKSNSHVENVYKISMPPDRHEDIILQGNGITTYDEQTSLMAVQSVSGTHAHLAASAKQQHGKFPQSSVLKGTQVVLSPQRLKEQYHKIQPPKTTQQVIQSGIHNPLIMKRIPELQLAPTTSKIGSGISSLNQQQTQRGRLFKYQVLNGNNAALVKRVMQETRSYLWTEMPNNQQSHFHFRWAPVSRSINFERLSHNFIQMVNHFEHHHEITTKNELFKNLKSHFDEKQQNVFQSIPLTFCLKVQADRQTQSIKQQLKPFKEVFNLLEEFKEHFSPTELIAQVQKLGNVTQDINNSAFSSNAVSQVITPFDQICANANTVLITQKGQESGYRDIVSNFMGEGGARVKKFTSRSSGLTMPMCHFAGQNVWILKPTGFNRGRGVHVVNSISKLKKLIKEYSRSKDQTTLIGNQPMYPVSKFLEPQAMNSQQLMNVTMQAALFNGPSSVPLVNLPMSGSKKSRQNVIGTSQSSTQPLKCVRIGDVETSQLISEIRTPKKRNSLKTPLETTNEKDKQVMAENEQEMSESQASAKPLDGEDSIATIEELDPMSLATRDPQVATRDQTPVILNEKSDLKNLKPSMHTTVPGYQKPSIRSKTFIIQKYIERPLLVNKRKFDIRVWVTLTHDLDIFFFREGYLRTSSQPYSMTTKNLDDDFIHLTNNAIQKNSADYGQHEDGNQLSFDDFKQKVIKSGAKVDFEADIINKMKYLCALTISTIRKKINPNRRKHCFELFGFDFFIDIDYNVWLIEVNTNPCIEESSKILVRLLPRMLDDLFKITIDQIYQPTKDQVTQLSTEPGQIPDGLIEKQLKNLAKGRSPYHVPGYKDNFNMWEKIGTLKSNASTSILVANPHAKQASRSEKLIHLVNQNELRVAKPEVIEKGIRRDVQQTGTSQLAFADY